MVDRVIKKKKWPLKRILTVAGITALVLLAFGSYYFTSGKSALNVELDRITISTVTKGPFQETIPVNGVVLPITSIYLDALEGGRVEEKYVEDGAIMKKGEPILRLSNTDLELNLANQQTSVYTLLSNMQLSSVTAQQNTVSKLKIWPTWKVSIKKRKEFITWIRNCMHKKPSVPRNSKRPKTIIITICRKRN